MANKESMSSTDKRPRAQIQTALTAFANRPLSEAALGLLDTLGYRGEKTADLGSTATALLGNIEQFNPDLGPIDRAKVQADRWQKCAFLFLLTDDEIPSLAKSQATLAGQEAVAKGRIESFVFLAIELRGERGPGWLSNERKPT